MLELKQNPASDRDMHCGHKTTAKFVSSAPRADVRKLNSAYQLGAGSYQQLMCLGG
jgi:hypothetical protein